MKKLFRLAGAVALGSALLVGCQKKEVTTTDTVKTTETTYAATPEATPASSDYSPTMSTPTPTPVP